MAVLDTAELVLRANRYSGSGDWLDESGNGHHATPVGSPSWDGEKFTLNGTDQWFTVPHHINLDPGLGDLSFIVVAAPPDPLASQGLLAKRGVTGGWWNSDVAADGRWVVRGSDDVTVRPLDLGGAVQA